MGRILKAFAPGLAGLAWILAVSAGTGCESRPSVESSTAEAQVKGTVYVKGVPVKKGKVVFDPANYKRKDAQARTATINPDGTYELKTLVGQNEIRVESPEATKANATYERITVDVPSGGMTQDIKLPREG
ncbi:MAG: hypothetical protein U0790_00580 [Isosphaeraceae bacterium]